MSKLTTTFQDNFTGGTILKPYYGNGGIAFPGTVGRFTCPNGAYCELAYSGSGAPVLFDVLRLQDPRRGVVLETKLSVFTGTTNQRFAVLFLGTTPFLDAVIPFYAYHMGYYKNEGRIIVDYYWPTSGARLFNSAAVADPSGTPHLYRIYWNPSTERNLWLAEFSANLAPDTLLFAYSLDGGTTWVSMGTRARDFPFTLMGITVRKWETSAVSATADFDHLLTKEYDVDQGDLLYRTLQTGGVLDSARLVPLGGLNDVGRRVPGSTARSTEDVQDGTAAPNAGPDSGGAPSDAAQFLPAGGGRDALLFSDPRVDAGSQEKMDTVGVLEDQLIFQFTGGPRNHNAPERLPETRGLLLDQLNTGALEDVLLYALQGAEWQDDVLDADGRETLNGGYLSEALLIDATKGTFGNPGLGHYGAARNGRFYDNGAECGLGAFGSLAGGKNRLAWRFPGEDPLGLPATYGTAALTADDELTFTLASPPSWADQNPWVDSARKWVLLTGDFDVQVDFAAYTASGDEVAAFLGLVANWGGSGGGNDFYLYRRGNLSGGRYEAARTQNGTWASLGTFTTSDASGKLRIARVSGTLSAYRWTGSAWVQVGSNYTHASVQGDLFVAIGVDGSASRTGGVKFSAFTLNSGVTSNRAGWYREAAGAERGSLQEMPANLAAVCTQTSLDLLDYDTGKLWMGFNVAVNNVLHGASSARPRRCAWANGVLLVGVGTEDWTTDGGSVMIDFRLDAVRIHRISASSWCGGFYFGEPVGAGAISKRNAAGAFTGFVNTDWAVKTYGARGMAAFDQTVDGGFFHWAVGGGTGVEIFRARLFNRLDAAPDPASCFSVETPRILSVAFDAAGQVFYLGDDAVLYSAPKTGWEAAFDNFPFAKQYSKPWPGATSRESQRRVVLRQTPTRIYAATEAGVYESDWPGAWTLLFGRAGTGAVHEILPFYDRVAAVAYSKEGAEEHLVCSLQSGVLHQLAVIDLATNLLWAVSPIQSDGRTSAALGVLS